MLTIRSLTREEVPAYNRLSSICFTYTQTMDKINDASMDEAKLQEMRGAFDETGRLVGGMIQIEMDARFEGKDCKLLGIGGVVTDPAERRHGAIRQLFEEGLPRLREKGFVFSALYPFSHEFYRKFGYEWAILQRSAEFETCCLRRNLRHAASIRRVLPGEDDQGMRRVYEAYIRDKNLSVVRDEEHWKNLREGTPWESLKHAYVLMDEAGEPMAYWIGEAVKDGHSAILEIKDMAYTRPEGCEAIFAMLTRMNEFSRIKLRVPQDVEMRCLLADPYNIKEQTECGGMVRVMDVQKALSLLPAPAEMGSFAIEVTDGQIAENNGRFVVTADGESVSVVRDDSAVCDLRCGIGGLTAMVMGLMDFEQSVAMGLGEVVREENRRLMAAVLHRRKAHLHNYF